MSYTLIFLALLLATVVWWLVKQTINVTPWASNTATDSVRDEGVRSALTTIPLPPIKLGLGVFLAVATSLFALFISAYSIRMEYPDWRPLPEPALLWGNTAILILSSVFLQWAWNAADRNDLQSVRRGILGGGVCALAFIAGQLIAWKQLSSTGYLITGNPANGFFYMLTGVHALHLLGGIIALKKSVSRVWPSPVANVDNTPLSDDENDIKFDNIRLGVELCAVYWHYLLVVWLILFGTMLAT